MTVFDIGAATKLSENTLDQVAWWDFENFFVPFGIPKIISVDADVIFVGIFKKTFQETLLIPVLAVSMVNHNSIRNE